LPQRRGDTIIGPVDFTNLPATYADAAASQARGGPGYQPPPGFNAQPMKVIATLRAGTAATLTVPRSERRWLRLLYDVSSPRAMERGAPAITLQACRTVSSRSAQFRECGRSLPPDACKRPYTEFNGGIYVDFAHAPKRGRCADLQVLVNGSSTPLVGRLFGRRCR
jgi:hypothetical protein